MKQARTTCLATGLAAALTVAAPAAVSAQEDSFAVRGFGAGTCADASEGLSEDSATASNALAWILGYMTAFNRTQADTFDISPIVDGVPILHLVAGLCAQNPEARVETVVFEVVRALAVARVRDDSEMVETVHDGETARVRRETLARMQERLIELGHLDGTADGAYGPQTRNALQAYQEAQDIPATGIADAVTIVRLLVEDQD